MNKNIAPTISPITAAKHQCALLNRVERLLDGHHAPSTRVTLDLLRHQLICNHLNNEGIYHTESVVGMLEVGQ